MKEALTKKGDIRKKVSSSRRGGENPSAALIPGRDKQGPRLRQERKMPLMYCIDRGKDLSKNNWKRERSTRKNMQPKTFY